MVILGIDPALTKLGWGVVEFNNSQVNYIDSGIIKSDNKQQIYLRLSYINQQISSIIDKYAPSVVSMEETFININATSSLKLAYVRGVIMSVVGINNLPFYEYKPNHIKKTLAGSGHADKVQIRNMIPLVISGIDNSVIKNFDENDALAIAYTCSVNFNFQNSLRRK